MELTVMECLKGMASEMCWGIRDAKQRFVNFTCYAYYGLKAATRKPRSFVDGLCRQSFHHIDVQLSKKGAPPVLRKVAGLALAVPTVVVRTVLIGGVIALWVWNAPQVACGPVWRLLISTPTKRERRRRVDLGKDSTTSTTFGLASASCRIRSNEASALQTPPVETGGPAPSAH